MKAMLWLLYIPVTAGVNARPYSSSIRDKALLCTKCIAAAHFPRPLCERTGEYINVDNFVLDRSGTSLHLAKSFLKNEKEAGGATQYYIRTHSTGMFPCERHHPKQKIGLRTSVPWCGKIYLLLVGRKSDAVHPHRTPRPSAARAAQPNLADAHLIVLPPSHELGGYGKVQ